MLDIFYTIEDKRQYVSCLRPIEYTPLKSEAFTHQLDNEELADTTEIEETVIKNIQILYEETGSLNLTIDFEHESERVGFLSLSSKDCNATILNKSYVKFILMCKNVISDNLIDIISKSKTIATISGIVSEPTSLAIEKEDSDIEELIEKISSKTKADILKPKETLDDYMCNSMLKEELEEIKDFFENEDKYKTAGVQTPKGVLFKGAPGTGKTYAARCLAGSTDCYFMSCTASALQGMYIGSGAENIRDVFKGAKALREASKKGVYLFIDELDSFGNRNTRTGGAGGEEDRTLNQLLAEMSGFEDSEGIMILGATNFPERIDEALTRSGRFSRQITINKPDFIERKAMISYYLKKLTLNLEDTDEDEIACITKGLTPADLKEIINEAAILSIRKKESTISMANINEAVNKVITKNIRTPDGKLDIHLVSAHESGHVLSEILYIGSCPIKVTSYGYGDAGGFTQPGSSLEGIYDKERYIAEIKTLLGGRAAELVLCGQITNGASNDFERAKAHIKRYYSIYHFEKYNVKDLDQIIIDTLDKLFNEVVEDFKKEDNFKILMKLTEELNVIRVMYTKDITRIASKLLIKGDFI